MKLSAAIAIALIGVTSAPAFAGGPRFQLGPTLTMKSSAIDIKAICSWLLQQAWTICWWIVKSKKGKFLAGVSIDHHIQTDMKDPTPNVGGGVDDNSCVEGAVLVVSLVVVLVPQHPVVMDAGGRSWASLVVVCLDVRLMGG